MLCRTDGLDRLGDLQMDEQPHAPSRAHASRGEQPSGCLRGELKRFAACLGVSGDPSISRGTAWQCSGFCERRSWVNRLFNPAVTWARTF
mmetsp:Transcript_12971/g.39022  ORF Transcript_12971/g.39022 Transcript_12971/m.39022 type:complete len:90 (-) Transcript_12971:198-467(-)